MAYIRYNKYNIPRENWEGFNPPFCVIVSYKTFKVFLDDIENYTYLCAMKEQWKAIKGHEGAYEVSNLGRVRSLDRYRRAAYGKIAFIRGIEVAIRKNNTNDYLVVRLSKDGKNIHALVHRLVAEAFVPNPNNLPQVNHKDEDKSNNRADNLEWCDQYYNNHYGTAIARRSITRGRKVVQCDLNGNEIARYNSAREAGRAIGKSQAAISRACTGEYKSAYGFLWRYED